MRRLCARHDSDVTMPTNLCVTLLPGRSSVAAKPAEIRRLRRILREDGSDEYYGNLRAWLLRSLDPTASSEANDIETHQLSGEPGHSKMLQDDSLCPSSIQVHSLRNCT
jgi:hypothetical protein